MPSPTPVRLDQSFTISSDLVNVGSGSVTNAQIDFYLSTDDNFSTSDFLVGSDTISVAPGSVATASATANPLSRIPGLTAGSYFAGLIIPSENEAWIQPNPVEVQAAQGGGGIDLTIDASFSGAWFDPSHDGEGFLLEILPGGIALAYWFTYDPQGNQAWLVGIGNISGNRIEFKDVLRPTGARFGDAFDPDDVVRRPWGGFAFEFTGCNTARMTYDGEWGAGAQSLERLWSIEGISCNQARKVLNGSHTGAWFDPDRDGEGFLIDVIADDTAVIYWFTYDNSGNQFWIVGVGTIVDGSIVVLDAISTSGGIFGPSFDPSDVRRTPWGALYFSFAPDGRTGGMRYEGRGAFGSGTIFLERLTQLADVPVTFDSGKAEVRVRGIVANNHVLDGDVNDTNTPERSNDEVATTQEVPNPVVISGFVTKTVTKAGRFVDEIDEFDGYRLTLAAGQAMFLEVSDHDPNKPAENDLDLLLYRTSDQQLVASSDSLQQIEEVAVPQAGEYDVVVRAFMGTSNYRLSIGNASQATSKLNTDPEWVPGQAIVSLTDSGKRAGDSVMKHLQESGFAKIAGEPDREMLISIETSVAKNALAAEKQTFAGTGWKVPLTQKRAEMLAIKALAQQPGVRVAEPNYIHHAAAIPSDEEFDRQWHYETIRLPQAWEIETGSQDVVVAVLDSGVAPHFDNLDNLDANLGADLISAPALANDDDGIDLDGSDPGDFLQPTRSSFHGTHVAGTVGASTNNGVGGAGVAWNVTIMPVRVLGIGLRGTEFDILQGLRWSAGLSNDLGRRPARTADIINMSLGGAGFSSQAQQLIRNIYNQGIILVAAAGNAKSGQPSFPAAYDGVISVSASTITDTLAPYSNFGSTIDLAAPGGDVERNDNGDQDPDGILSNGFNGSVPTSANASINLKDGTSMASPHVAGVIALMKSQFPSLTPDQLDDAIRTGQITDDIFGDGAAVRNNSFGYGRINALKAVQWARQMANAGETVVPILTPSLSTISLGADAASREISISNEGGGSIRITSVSDDQPWLDVETKSVDGQGLGTYTITVDRSGLVPARYRGQVRFAGSDGSRIDVTVTMDVGAVEVAGESGTVYVLFMDARTRVAAAQVALAPSSSYGIRVELLPGLYYIVAGTDNDSDFLICDEGEVCGGYPTLDEIAVFELSEGSVNLGTFQLVAPASLSGTGSGSKSLEWYGQGLRRQ